MNAMSIGLVYTFEPTLPTFALAEGHIFNIRSTYIQGHSILVQAAALAATGAPTAPLLALARKVKSGDPDNLEAQGARRYWQLLFGDGFRRDQNETGRNALLN